MSLLILRRKQELPGHLIERQAGGDGGGPAGPLLGRGAAMQDFLVNAGDVAVVPLSRVDEALHHLVATEPLVQEPDVTADLRLAAGAVHDLLIQPLDEVRGTVAAATTEDEAIFECFQRGATIV